MQEPPFAFVVIDGVATLTYDPAAVAAGYRTIAARYGSAGNTEPTGDPYNRGAGVLVRVAPLSVLAISYDD